MGPWLSLDGVCAALGPGTEPTRLETVLRENLHDNLVRGLRRPLAPAQAEHALDAWRMVSMLPFYATPTDARPGPVRAPTGRPCPPTGPPRRSDVTVQAIMHVPSCSVHVCFSLCVGVCMRVCVIVCVSLSVSLSLCACALAQEAPRPSESPRIVLPIMLKRYSFETSVFFGSGARRNDRPVLLPVEVRCAVSTYICVCVWVCTAGVRSPCVSVCVCECAYVCVTPLR
jgi:hypothetical protein